MPQNDPKRPNKAMDGKNGIPLPQIVIQLPEKKTFGMEEALKQLGGYSYFQLFVTIVLVFTDFPCVMVLMNPLLTGNDNVPFKCIYENGTITQIPKEELCSFNCSQGSIVSGDNIPRSIVQEWSLICDKAWIPDAVLSIQMGGSLIGGLLVAYLSDRFGRKKAYYSNVMLMALIAILCSASTSPLFFGIGRFLTGFTIGASFTSHFNYLMEFLPASWRQICGCVSFWSVGEMCLGLIGYLIPSWRTVSWVTGFPALLISLTIFLIPESPRWALAHEETSVAADSFRIMSKWNSKPPLTSEEIIRLQENVIYERDMEGKQEGGVIAALIRFRKWSLLKVLLAFGLAWFSNAVVYYGITFNMKNISGNIYWNIFFLGLVDLPAELSGFYFSNRYGRRSTFVAYLLVSSVFLVILVVVDFFWSSEYPTAILVLSLAGRFFSEGSWAIMACFTSESFPTVCRAFTLGCCTMMSTIGGMVAPQLLGHSIPKTIPYVVFAVLSILSSFASMSIPEMKGKPLQDA